MRWCYEALAVEPNWIAIRHRFGLYQVASPNRIKMHDNRAEWMMWELRR
jgi:hypothetical protein